MCRLADMGVTEKNIVLTSYVNEDGSADELIDTYYGDMDKGYYRCVECLRYWHWTMADRLSVWQKVKEHLDD